MLEQLCLFRFRYRRVGRVIKRVGDGHFKPSAPPGSPASPWADVDDSGSEITVNVPVDSSALDDEDSRDEASVGAELRADAWLRQQYPECTLPDKRWF